MPGRTRFLPQHAIAHAGNVDFVVTGGTLRTQPNTGNACAVTSSDSANLTGIPAGATIQAAYLYWAGSGPSADNTVRLNGSVRSADRTFTEAFTDLGLQPTIFFRFCRRHGHCQR